MRTAYALLTRIAAISVFLVDVIVDVEDEGARDFSSCISFIPSETGDFNITCIAITPKFVGCFAQ